jgi:hypothetical protein
MYNSKNFLKIKDYLLASWQHLVQNTDLVVFLLRTVDMKSVCTNKMFLFSFQWFKHNQKYRKRLSFSKQLSLQ